MAKTELVLPPMGEGIIEATITRWLVSAGATVEEEQPLVEISTDKVDSEIPSPAKGVISELLVDEGDIVSVGDLLAIIETEAKLPAENLSGHPEPETAREVSPQPESLPPDEDEGSRPAQEIPRQTPSGKFLTPLVRSIAVKENIPPAELDNIEGSGEGGRITKSDILNWLEGKHRHTQPDKAHHENKTAEISGKETGKESPGEKPGDLMGHDGRETDEARMTIPMDRRRKLIAEHMLNSRRTSAHVTSFIDADVTELVQWRESVRQKFRERENQNLTFTPFFVEASARALRDFPMVNVSVEGSAIIMKKEINIGIAVALPDLNLVVPVIKTADEKNLTGLARAVNDLATRARENRLKPDEITGGTFTVTNFGTFRNTAGTPIINQPQVAILGTGAIVKKPVVLETELGDVIAIRHIMTLSLSYDHRVIDGALGGKFLARIADLLTNFDKEQKI